MEKIIKPKRIDNLKMAFSASFLFAAFFLLLIAFVAPAAAEVKLETVLPPIPNQPSPDKGLPEYINYLFVFGLSSITILALAQMIIGGITYILAAGNAAKVEEAKDTIFQALLGVGILLVSYLLLWTINPDLVSLRNPNLTPSQFRGEYNIGGGAKSYQWANIPNNQYCANVLGKDWRDVDSRHCTSAKQGEINTCCGHFPPK